VHFMGRGAQRLRGQACLKKYESEKSHNRVEYAVSEDSYSTMHLFRFFCLGLQPQSERPSSWGGARQIINIPYALA
jgi:hypothetical protein